ncbi:MAG: hypothetical protein ACI9FU_000231 [Granulosicoccus sp.]
MDGLQQGDNSLIMPNILYIGDPFSIHEIKWMSFFSTQPDYKVFIAAQDIDVEKMTQADHDRLTQYNITLIPGLRFYSARRPWDNWHSAKVIRKAIKQHRIDLVHGLFFTPYCVNTLYTNLPTVITSRGSDVLTVLPELRNKTGIQGWHDKHLFRVFKKVVRRANAITCTSKKQQQSLLNLFGNSTETNLIRTGVDVETISKTDSIQSPVKKMDGRKMVLFPRYISPIYNTMFQVEALKLLPQKIKDQCQFVFISGRYLNPDYFEKVKAEMSEINVVHQFLNHMTQQEIWALYNQADLTVMTPISDGTPNSALEAMAARSMLILGNLDYDKDIFNSDSCLKMTSNNHAELAEIIENCITHPNTEILESAYQTVLKKGDRAVEMGKLQTIYEQLLSK